MFKKPARLEPPTLVRRAFPAGDVPEPVVAWTDEALWERNKVRVAFTERQGGVSAGGCASLNLAAHVDDDPAAVRANRNRLMGALGAPGVPLVVPKQVHGDRIVALATASTQAVGEFQDAAARGADALQVGVRGVAALLNFADCVPLVIVAPSGRFAVVHAGWRGVENGIVGKAVRKLALGEPGLAVDAASFNVYRGAYIHGECFETGEDVHQLFVERFGCTVAWDGTHIDLGRALDIQLAQAGIDAARIADVGRCTVCDNAHWFSYRAQGGTCGRHAALCFAR